MSVYILYSITVLMATTLGACAGLGGGVIIKPVLDLMNVHDVATISFLSTSSVFAMAIYSSVSQLKRNTNFNYKIAVLGGSGSAIGGIIGSKIFSLAVISVPDQIVKFVQAVLLIMLLSYVLINSKHTTSIRLKNQNYSVFIGFLLGVTSSFLGIGGGPINVAVFVMFFSMNFKEASIYSLVTILCSQATNLLTIYITTGFSVYDYSLLFVLIPVALLGGYIGVRINKKISNESVKKVFNVSILVIILINIYNAIQAIINI